jgi:hypothetical protein
MRPARIGSGTTPRPRLRPAISAVERVRLRARRWKRPRTVGGRA